MLLAELLYTGETPCQSLSSVSEGRFGQGYCDVLIQSGDWPVRYLQCPHATILQEKAKIELRLTGRVVPLEYCGLFVCCQDRWKNVGENLNWTSRLEIAWKSPRNPSETSNRIPAVILNTTFNE